MNHKYHMNQLAGGSVVAALVGIEDDAEWKIGTDEYCSWAAMVGVVMGRGSCFLLLLEYVQVVIAISNSFTFGEKTHSQL
jgi:hypothetical protein